MVFVRDLLMMKKEKGRFGRVAQSFVPHPIGITVFAGPETGMYLQVATVLNPCNLGHVFCKATTILVAYIWRSIRAATNA